MALFDLSDRAKIRITGSDRVRFLNGQVTNDVRKANSELSLPACVVNAKAKTEAFVFISSGQEEFLLDTDPELRETLPQRLSSGMARTRPAGTRRTTGSSPRSSRR